jgi:hypothetical protein
MPGVKTNTIVNLALWMAWLTANLASADSSADAPPFDPPSIRPPSALTADAADSQAFLEWNPGLEDDLAGYRVYRRAPQGSRFELVTPKPIERTTFTDTGLANALAYRYRVTSVLRGGKESDPSNEITVEPGAVAAPQVTEGPADIQVPGFDPIHLSRALTILFENGHRLVFDIDLARARDWIADDGTHLLSPKPYGNAIDLAELDDLGLPKPLPATAERPAAGPPINLDYQQRKGDMAAMWVGHTTSANRITLQYRIPLAGPGVPQGTSHDAWIWATVRETWTPVTRDLGGTKYGGLARRIELELPSYYKDGFSVCPNDGFGADGSCAGAVTYELRWSDQSFLLETRWEKGKDAKGCGSPRGSSGFHPTECATQVMPFLFAHFPKGTLILAPRRYHFATSYCWRNYAAQGHDGLWPNYAVDVVSDGRPLAAETFEWLWAPGQTPPAPQRFMDATFRYRRRLADLYGLKRDLPCMDYAWDYWGPGREVLRVEPAEERYKLLAEWGAKTAARAKAAGADRVGGCHELWTSSPYTVDDAVRLDPDHPLNRAILEMNRAFAAAGIQYGYWVRPEFVKQALPNVLSTRFYTPYYGYQQQTYPPAIPLVEDRGLPLIREHPGWIRVARDGSHPQRTPYNWTPMSLSSGDWYGEVIYKSLVMMKRLGFSSVFQDGGYSALSGVDYTGGKARPVQPYYWQFYRDIAHLGMDLSGECPVGWPGNTLPTPNPKDLDSLWAYTLGTYRGNREAPLAWFTPEMRHRSHQLYIGTYIHLDSPPGHAVAARFGQEFVKKNGAPDRVFLEGLRQDDGGKWVWDKVWWEYADGRRVQYPDWAEVAGK